MTDLTLYHNPRCSKSRGALELLEARGLSPSVVRYLETPPTAAQLTDLLAKVDGTTHFVYWQVTRGIETRNHVYAEDLPGKL